MTLKNKSIIITGSSSGLGKALAIKLLQKGANVTISSHNKEELQKTEKDLRSRGSTSSQDPTSSSKTNKKSTSYKVQTASLLAIPADVTKIEDIKNLFKQTNDHFGKVDILINNAGINIKKPFQEFTEQDMQMIFGTNVKGVMIATQEAVKYIKHGKIINISSVAGWFGAKNYALYSASKHAVEGFSKCIKKELSVGAISYGHPNSHKIKIQTFHPYRLKTNLSKNYTIKSPSKHQIDPYLYAEYITASLEDNYPKAIFLFLRNWLIRLKQILS